MTRRWWHVLNDLKSKDLEGDALVWHNIQDTATIANKNFVQLKQIEKNEKISVRP
jgi:hypothetical protein